MRIYQVNLADPERFERVNRESISCNVCPVSSLRPPAPLEEIFLIVLLPGGQRARVKARAISFPGPDQFIAELLAPLLAPLLVEGVPAQSSNHSSLLPEEPLGHIRGDTIAPAEHRKAAFGADVPGLRAEGGLRGRQQVEPKAPLPVDSSRGSWANGEASSETTVEWRPRDDLARPVSPGEQHSEKLRKECYSVPHLPVSIEKPTERRTYSSQLSLDVLAKEVIESAVKALERTSELEAHSDSVAVIEVVIPVESEPRPTPGVYRELPAQLPAATKALPRPNFGWPSGSRLGLDAAMPLGDESLFAPLPPGTQIVPMDFRSSGVQHASQGQAAEESGSFAFLSTDSFLIPEDSDAHVLENDQGALLSRIRSLNVPQQQELAQTGSKEIRKLLMEHGCNRVHLFVFLNPGITNDEVRDYVRRPDLAPDALRVAASSSACRSDRRVVLASIHRRSSPVPPRSDGGGEGAAKA